MKGSALKVSSLPVMIGLFALFSLVIAGVDISTGRWPKSAPLIGAIWLMLTSIFVLIAVHEAGHFIAARRLGWKITAVRIWFLSWALEGDRLRPAFSWTAPDGGQVSSLPVNSDRFEQEFPKMILGGPLASLIAALALTPLAFLLPFPLGAAPVFVAWLFLVLSLVPMTRMSLGNGTDGWWLLQAIRKSPALKVRGRFALIQGLTTSGVPYKDLTPELFEGLDEIESPVADRWIGLSMVGSYRWVQGDGQGALATWRKLGPFSDPPLALGTVYPRLIRLDCAMGELLAGDQQLGRQLMEGIGDLGQNQFMVSRVEAFDLWLRGEREEALGRAEEFGRGLAGAKHIHAAHHAMLLQPFDQLDPAFGNAVRRGMASDSA